MFFWVLEYCLLGSLLLASSDLGLIDLGGSASRPSRCVEI